MSAFLIMEYFTFQVLCTNVDSVPYGIENLIFLIYLSVTKDKGIYQNSNSEEILQFYLNNS